MRINANKEAMVFSVPNLDKTEAIVYEVLLRNFFELWNTKLFMPLVCVSERNSSKYPKIPSRPCRSKISGTRKVEDGVTGCIDLLRVFIEI